MTEAEALDMAAKAYGWDNFADAAFFYGPDCTSAPHQIAGIRAHAKTIMENAALKAENEALEARVAGLTHERDFHRETADLHADRIEALEAENGRLRHAVGVAIRNLEEAGYKHKGYALTTLTTALKEIANGDR